MNVLSFLNKSEKKAKDLFETIIQKQVIIAGKSEKQLNNDIYQITSELFGIKKFWHKCVVCSGKNTLLPNQENSTDLIINEDYVLFFDFDPVFEEWEPEIGKTNLLGNDY